MKSLRWLTAAALVGAAEPALAGPPYLTDDPIPTELRHWEIYAFTSGEGLRSEVDEDAGLDINYGPVKDVQLTATLPLSFDHDPADGWEGGTGDVELAVKYQFLREDTDGFSAAVFPRVILPTASHSPGERANVLLPIWLSKDFGGGTTVFGGGGYQVNPGAGNRNFWQAAVAVTKDVSNGVSVGAEIARQGSDIVQGTAKTQAGVGTNIQLSQHCALLFSGGPTWADDRTGYHFYGALGFTF